MHHMDVLQYVRELVRAGFTQLGAGEGLQVSESILLRDGLYCGRRFQTGDVHAVWFVEEDELKIYAEDGSLAGSMAPSEEIRPEVRRAA
jgi:hypothetical protein